MYADFSYYSGTYGGTLDNLTFTKASVRAAAILNSLTHGRLEKPIDSAFIGRVKLAECALIDAVSETLGDTSAGLVNAGVSSERTGDVSVSYGSAGGGNAYADAQLEKYRYLVGLYLAPTGLMYRG